MRRSIVSLACSIILKEMVSSDPCQICRVEDLLVNGLIRGSIIHIHRARTVIIDTDGMITASELGKKVYSKFVSLVAMLSC